MKSYIYTCANETLTYLTSIKRRTSFRKMTVRFPEVIRSGSEVEGGLSGPANPIPNQSIDCGCGQLQCPKLAKFATRKFFVGMICWIGIVQAASYAYFHVTGSTIARRFQIDPYVMGTYLTDDAKEIFHKKNS